MHRLMAMAVYPLRLRSDNPLPRGWVPSVASHKAVGWLYPDEEARLLNCTEVPLHFRLYYGFLSREGCRKSEALGLTWADVDLQRGVVNLDTNKTDRPRTWALGKDVAAAMQIVFAMREHPADDESIFIGARGVRFAEVHASTLREHLHLADVDRPQLYERSEHRKPINMHSLRHGFVTLSLATGKSESWVRARTGHRSSVMLAHYEATKLLAEELDLGWFANMVEATPELARGRRFSGPDWAPNRPQRSERPSRKREKPNNLNWLRRQDSNLDWRIQSPQSCL